MGTIPTTPTFVAGEKLTAAKLNQMVSAVDFWALTPRCSIYQGTTPTTFTTSVYGLVGFDSELFDIVQSGDTASHDLATNNSRLYIRTTGKYEISGQLMFAPNATGSRIVIVRLNAAGSSSGGSLISQTSQGAVSGNSTSVPISPFELPLTAGDYLEMFAFQSSGGNLASNVGQANTYLRAKLSAQ